MVRLDDVATFIIIIIFFLIIIIIIIIIIFALGSKDPKIKTEVKNKIAWNDYWSWSSWGKDSNNRILLKRWMVTEMH